MRKEYVIFIILLGALLPSGCAENGSVEPEPSVSPVETPVEIPATPSETPFETPVLPAEVPQGPAGNVETPENTSDQIPSENLTRTEPENLSETRLECLILKPKPEWSR